MGRARGWSCCLPCNTGGWWVQPLTARRRGGTHAQAGVAADWGCTVHAPGTGSSGAAGGGAAPAAPPAADPTLLGDFAQTWRNTLSYKEAFNEVLHHRRPASVIQHESPVRNVRPNSAFQNNTELVLSKFVLDEASAGDALYAAAEHEMPVIFCRGNVCRVVPLEKRKEAYFTTGVS